MLARASERSKSKDIAQLRNSKQWNKGEREVVKKKLEREEEEEEAVTSCDVHDVFQVLLLLLQLINCGDGGTKRLPFAEAYKIPLYLLQRVGEGRGRVGSAD